MQEQTVKTPILIYTEETPNPDSLKFVVNIILYPGGTGDFRDVESAQKWSPLAAALFEFPYVKGVYISNNFVSVTKEATYSWVEIQQSIKDFIKHYVIDDKPVINEGYGEELKRLEEERIAKAYSGDTAAIVQKIKDLIETVVKPAVANDGGNIEFKSYDKGVVTVIMQGSCSGCPSSTLTLKAGIEGMLKRMVPEVLEVVSEMG
ncbi:MAG: NifU family protein [Saprospiraceae bacterium]|nr:MAG: nitrogen-fixing NifU domain-containing protein [Candidatus Parvibacillus calidus]MCC7148622.1 NifU family protein [Saprospiraceae bacterium]